MHLSCTTLYTRRLHNSIHDACIELYSISAEADRAMLHRLRNIYVTGAGASSPSVAGVGTAFYIRFRAGVESSDSDSRRPLLSSLLSANQIL